MPSILGISNALSTLRIFEKLSLTGINLSPYAFNLSEAAFNAFSS